MKAEWVDGFEIRVTAEKGETVDGCKDGKIDACVAVVISNNGESMALQRANTFSSVSAKVCVVI